MDKSICDGLNKLYAASANLQQTKSNRILTPRQFFEWSNSHLLNHSGLCFRDFDAGGARLMEHSESIRTDRGARSHNSSAPVD